MKQAVNINEVKENDLNPRYINESKFNQLVKSLKSFPKMLEKRPIVVDENMVILGGNMRLRACKEAGMKTVWIDKTEGWTEEEKQEFIIKDNVNFGDWDWDILANDWDNQLLNDWGLQVWQGEDVNIDNMFEDITSDDQKSKNSIILKYDEEEYLTIQEKIKEDTRSAEEIFRQGLIK